MPRICTHKSVLPNLEGPIFGGQPRRVLLLHGMSLRNVFQCQASFEYARRSGRLTRDQSRIEIAQLSHLRRSGAVVKSDRAPRIHACLAWYSHLSTVRASPNQSPQHAISRIRSSFQSSQMSLEKGSSSSLSATTSAFNGLQDSVVRKSVWIFRCHWVDKIMSLLWTFECLLSDAEKIASTRIARRVSEL